MRILLATDGSGCSEVTLNELASRPWPPRTDVKIISVVHLELSCLITPALIEKATYDEVLEAQQKLATQHMGQATGLLRDRAPHLHVTTEVLAGLPKEVIVDEAERWGADLIMMGSHGYGPAGRIMLGSVSLAVALHAQCSVEIVRKCRRAGTDEGQND
jgi:nucleotide-binding universal stress UspA family protein